MAFRKTKFELSPRLKLGVGRGYSQNQILKLAAILCLVLALGLTVNAIRLMVKGNGQKSPQPEVLGASTDNSSAPTIEFTSYTVEKGDTLFNISQKLNISWTSLAAINSLKSPFYLKPGQTLKVPKQ